jgi:hypothetical protein
MVVDLFLQRGTFWEYVHKARAAGGIVPAVRTPEPVDTRAYYPPSWDRAGEVEQQLIKGAWLNIIHALRRDLIPEIYRLPDSPINWVAFLSACLLYDPPDTELLAFARIGDENPVTAEAEEQVRDADTELSTDALVLPIKMLPDPDKVKEDAHWYRDAIIEEIGRRFIEPQGLDTWEVFESVIRTIRRDEEGNSWYLAHEYASRQLDYELQPYIFVTDETTEEDVKKAFRAIKASRRQRRSGGRPRRDRLVAVQCAILYDRHRAIDPTDKRRRNWTYESLAQEFDLESADAAEAYVDLGRKIMAEKDTP